MLAAEEAVFARGVCAEKLMKKAGLGIAIAILERWPDPGKLTCYLGKGNNGGGLHDLSLRKRRRGGER